MIKVYIKGTLIILLKYCDSLIILFVMIGLYREPFLLHQIRCVKFYEVISGNHQGNFDISEMFSNFIDII